MAVLVALALIPTTCSLAARHERAGRFKHGAGWLMAGLAVLGVLAATRF